MFSFVDRQYELEIEYADSGFYEEYPPEWETYFDWVPPVNRKRHPAGDGTFCSSPDPPLQGEEDVLVLQSEAPLPGVSTPASQPLAPATSAIMSEVSLPPATSGTEPLGAYLLRRFLDDDHSGDNEATQPVTSQEQ